MGVVSILFLFFLKRMSGCCSWWWYGHIAKDKA